MKKKPQPILVAAAQFVDRDQTGSGAKPLDLLAIVSKLAAEDSGSSRILDSVDQIAVAGLTVDAPQAKTPLSGGYKNLPKSLANQLNIKAKNYFYCGPGGNTPQFLVNHFSKAIAAGEAETVLLAGAESLATLFAKFDRWYKWLLPKSAWRDNPGGTPRILGSMRASGTPQEDAHGLDLPANVYPLFENALRHKYARTIADHQQAIGDLFSGFSAVAARNPYAWFQRERNAEELITPSNSNRMVGFPYTKYLNSMLAVNQAAALIMTTEEKAESLKIPRQQWIYLHGFADCNDIWNVTERENFHSSPALRACGEKALSMAGACINDIRHFDLYSCFPSAVQVARDELGIDNRAPEELTLTGGLPYFGGPGNNYSMHGIAEMIHRLRQHTGEFGLVNANGWFLTKHSIGVYSSMPPGDALATKGNRYDDQNTVIDLEQLPVPTVEKPSGSGTIETFTVLFDKRNQPKKGIIIGRDQNNARFVANTPNDKDMLHALCKDDAIGRSGTITQRGNLNLYTLDD